MTAVNGVSVTIEATAENAEVGIKTVTVVSKVNAEEEEAVEIVAVIPEDVIPVTNAVGPVVKTADVIIVGTKEVVVSASRMWKLRRVWLPVLCQSKKVWTPWLKTSPQQGALIPCLILHGWFWVNLTDSM